MRADTAAQGVRAPRRPAGARLGAGQGNTAAAYNLQQWHAGLPPRLCICVARPRFSLGCAGVNGLNTARAPRPRLTSFSARSETLHRCTHTDLAARLPSGAARGWAAASVRMHTWRCHGSCFQQRCEAPAPACRRQRAASARRGVRGGTARGARWAGCKYCRACGKAPATPAARRARSRPAVKTCGQRARAGRSGRPLASGRCVGVATLGWQAPPRAGRPAHREALMAVTAARFRRAPRRLLLLGSLRAGGGAQSAVHAAGKSSAAQAGGAPAGGGGPAGPAAAAELGGGSGLRARSCVAFAEIVRPLDSRGPSRRG